MPITLSALQKQRRDTASNWTSSNPTLLAGELAHESDTGLFKIGDGSTVWNSLAYLPIPNTSRLLDGNLTVGGNLTVSGTTTTIDTTTLTVEDKNIEIGKVTTPSDTTADGGGITLLGASNKTIVWTNSTDSWDFNQHVNIATGTEFKINNVSVLNATTLGSSVVSSSLTSVGTLSALQISGDVTFTGASYNVTWDKSADDLIFNDNAQACFGTGSDLKLYHNGTNDFIQSNGGYLKIQTDSLKIHDRSDDHPMITAANNGAVELYYDNSKKFQTESWGTQVTSGQLYIASGCSFKVADSTQIQVGDSADLKIYHDGSNSLINASGTGSLIVQGADDIFIRPQDGEDGIKAIGDGAIQLFYDGSGTPKLETYADGIKVYDDVWVPDNGVIRCGTRTAGGGGDLHIYHDGSHSYIKDTGTGELRLASNQFTVQNAAADETLLYAVENGAVGLKYDDSLKLETYSLGVNTNDSNIFINGDNGKFIAGAGSDLQIYHNGSHSFIQNSTGNLYIWGADGHDGNIVIQATYGEESIIADHNGAVKLYYDNSKKFETLSDGARITGHLKMNDSEDIRLGTGGDLKLYHDGSNSYIKDEGTGDLYIRNGSDNSIICKTNNAVELYYNDTKRFHTNSVGAYVTGRLGISDYLYIENAADFYLEDNGKAHFGSDSDLQIYFNGSDTVFYAARANNYSLIIQNDGNDVNRYGFIVRCGSNDASGTNYAITITDGDQTVQGYITFTGGTVTYGAFTAHHPCIVPDADNPSDNANAYPYGTLLETISIEYTQKNGANTERGIRYKVQKTQSANSRKVLGAYGSSMNGGPDGQINEHQVLILGDGHILVNNAGGNIEIGDGICSSATAGIGQKATANPSMIIGIAQEAITFTGSETKLVAVQYGLQQFTPWT